MLIHQNKKGENILHLPFFRRAQDSDSRIRTQGNYSYKYTLLGVARNVLSGVDLYDSYFLSKYTKQYDRLRRRGEVSLHFNHLSQFFKHFLQVYAIKSLIEKQKNTTLKVNLLTNNLFGIRSDSSLPSSKIQIYTSQKRAQLNELQNCLKPFINNIFLKWRELKAQNEQERIKQAEILLAQRMKLIQQDLGKSELLQNEYLPNIPKGSDDKYLKRYFLNQYQKIINLQVFQMHTRKEILSLFNNINRKFMMIKIIYTMESTKSKTLDIFNDIYLPSYSNQRTFIATKLNKKRLSSNKEGGNQEKKPTVQQILLGRFEVIKSVVSYLSKYYKSTNHFYPNLSVSDIYFDQKKLVIFVSHHPLLLNAVGINKPVKSQQLCLATENTPNFDYQLSHLEYNDQNLRMLKQKYYFPSQYRRTGDEDEDLEKQKSGNEGLAQLQERIHVWRLINILYYICHQKYLTKSLYPHYYRRNQEPKPDTPFKFKTYKEIIQQIYVDITQNAGYLIELLPPIRLALQINKLKQGKETVAQSIWRKQLQPLIQGLSQDSSVSLRKAYLGRHADKQEFKFTLQSLRLKFDIVEDDDSLLESLQIASIKSQLYIRFILFKEINNLLIDKKSFKKFMNAKKYTLLYLMSLLQQIYLINIIRKNSKLNPNFKRQLLGELEKEYHHILFSSQFDRRESSKKACEEKLYEYQLREDVNKRFLESNSFYKKHIQIVKNNIEQIQMEQSFQGEYLTRQKLAPQQVDYAIEEAGKLLSESEQSELRLIRSQFLMLQCLQELLAQLKKPLQSAEKKIIHAIYSKFMLNPEMLNFQKIEQILEPFFREQQKETMIDIIIYLRERQANNQDKMQHKIQLTKLSRCDLIEQFFKSLRGKSKQSIQKCEHSLRSIIFVDERNQKDLIKMIQDFKYKLTSQLELTRFKQSWSEKIDKQINQSYMTLHTDIQTLTQKELQPFLKKPESFHKITDFNESKAGAQLCLFFNNKLLTLLKAYLKMDDSNWRHLERIYNLIQIQDKTINVRTANRPIETSSPEAVRMYNAKLQLIMQSVQNMPKDFNSVFKSKHEEVKIGKQSMYGRIDRQQQASRDQDLSRPVQAFLKQTLDI